MCHRASVSHWTIAYILTLVFGRFVSEAMVNRSLDLGLIAKETTMFYGHKFVFTNVL